MNWQPIPNYPQYEVSDEGQVRRTKGGKILYPYARGGNRLTINLSIENKPSTLHVARLVWLAHRGAIPPHHHIFHCDCNYANNQVSNLFMEKRGYK